MCPDYVCETVKVGALSTEVPRKMLGGSKLKTYSNFVALDELGQEIEKRCNDLHQRGYEVISIMPVIRGECDSISYYDGGAGWGYSVTEGAVITARRRG